MNERKYLVALYSFLSFGPARVKLLHKYFGSYEKVWNADNKKLTEVGLKNNLVAKFSEHKNNFDFKNYFNRLKKLSINYITIDDKDYPENLLDISNAPAVLYYLGEFNKNDVNAVAIVGSRKMTTYGKEVAEKFSFELASLGVTIISGLALGVDAVAHRLAIDAGGRSIAVLASGLDAITPVTNQRLAIEIIKRKKGSIMSEYPLGYRPQRQSFANRNRIISGLSKAVLVVEGRRKSGTLLTASAAAEQGRAVFAVPGQITSPMSEAPFFLIENGAKMAVKVKDILDELDMQLKVDLEAVAKVMPSDKIEEKLLEILENEQMHLDEIARISKLSVNKVSSKLTIMELKGLVRNLGGGTYKIG